MVLLAIINMLFATWCWIDLYSSPDYVVENYAQAHIPKDRKVTVFSMWGTPVGSTRLERLGYSYEHRPYQKWSTDPSGMPDVVFATRSAIEFVDTSIKFPARAEMWKNDSGFDIANYRSPEQLGYTLSAKVKPEMPPWWFPPRGCPGRVSTLSRVITYSSSSGPTKTVAFKSVMITDP